MVDVADVLTTIFWYFLGTDRPLIHCLDSADANDDGEIDISDPIRTLMFLFIGDAFLPPPFPEPGTDPTEDALGCEMYASCPE